MTTSRQVKQLLSPLLERHDDLAVIGHWLIVRPVRHVLRGVILERTGDASRFRPRWAVTNLCEPQTSFPVSWGAMIVGKGRWRWDNPTLQNDLFHAIEEQALPSLRSIQTLDDFVAFTSSRERFPLTYFYGYLLRKVGLDIARGDLEAAKSVCAKLATGHTKWSMPLLRDDFIRVTETLCPLLARNDVRALAKLLHEWEAITVQNLKVADLWDRTPFPLEQVRAS
jgi:hypothetical protein